MSPTPRRRSSATTRTRRSSLIALENGALGVVDPQELSSIRSSIGGRLGGSIGLSLGGGGGGASPLDKLKDFDYEEGTAATEGTTLVGGHEKEMDSSSSAPLVVWIGPALICASTYAFYNIFIKKGSYTIHPILGGVILQFVAALLGSILLGVLIANEPGAMDKIEYDRKGLWWSVCAGLAVGSAEMLSFCVSGMGVQATQSIPIIIGGSVFFGAILGLLLLGEKLMLHGWMGVVLLVSGIGMVATDPGEKVEEGGGGDFDTSPPMAVWIGPALVCAGAYAFYNIFIKKGSASINPILGGVVLQFVAALFGTILLVALTIKEGGTSYLNYDAMGIIWACCAGIAVGAAEMLSFVVSGMGVQASQSIPIIIGGSVMFGAVLGLVMLGETLMLQGWLGVTLLMVGIGVVATDPGEKVAGH